MKNLRSLASTIVLSVSMSTVATIPMSAFAKAEVSEVMETYVNIAHAGYSDSLITAKALQASIDAFLNSPTAETLQAAKDAWLLARIPYGQTEVYRFGNANVDEWEGKVNAWPLDEGLIDYVNNDSYEHEDGNKFATANVIAGKETIDQALLESFHEKGGSEANVATGYHAIEFLLWGQDLNEKPQDSGKRSHTDYIVGKGCTNGNCERRGQYLKAATDLLVKDLEEIVADWSPEKDNYRKAFMALSEKEAVRRMLFGMGSLSLGELAGERINVALLAHSQEDEHSCFSDNTHIDTQEDARGIQNVYMGSYTRVDGSKVEGPSISDLVAAKDSALDKSLTARLIASMEASYAVTKAAEGGEHFDQQIAAENKEGNTRIKAVIKALRAQTVDIEAASKVLGIDDLSPENSDSFKAAKL